MKAALRLKNAFLTYFYESETNDQIIVVKEAIKFIQSYTSDLTCKMDSERLYAFGVSSYNLFTTKINHS
jgi:hypothetical protein